MEALNVQADLRARLEEALAPVEVRASVPADRPQRLVTVTREGGGRDNALIDSPGIGIYCWAPTEAEAAELSERAAEVIESLPFLAGYARVEKESQRSDPDTESRSPRWYLSYSMKTFKPTT